MPNQAANGRNLRLSRSPRQVSQSPLYGLLSASGSVVSSFFTRESPLKTSRCRLLCLNGARYTRLHPLESLCSLLNSPVTTPKGPDVTTRQQRRPAQPVPRYALTRQEAAASLGMSIDTFERRVQPFIMVVPC